jgi:curli production assembly/transport component CsgF
MTFQFRNPNFGGNPNNGAFLLNEAQAQNSYKDPSLKDFSVDTPSALDNFTRLFSRRFWAVTDQH